MLKCKIHQQSPCHAQYYQLIDFLIVKETNQKLWLLSSVNAAGKIAYILETIVCKRNRSYLNIRISGFDSLIHPAEFKKTLQPTA